MRRIVYIALLTSFVVCIVSVQAADFGPIFPKQAAKMVTPPNFTWATGEYDFFVLVVLAPIPGYWYQPIAIPQKKSFFLMPEAWWDAMVVDGWGLWFVLGMNTTSWGYAVTPWQSFQRVTDCEVEFPDPNLDAEIRRLIKKPNGPILASDLLRINHLVIDLQGDALDLDGMEYCTALDSLWIRGGSVVDTAPLAGLTNLVSLNVLYDIDPEGCWDLLPSVQQEIDLSPVAGLVNLIYFRVVSLQITDLAPLEDLSNMAWLELTCCQISDIGPLGSLTRLRDLTLIGNQISDLSPLSRISDIEYLDLTKNEISDLFPLVANYVHDYEDVVILTANPLSTTSCETWIPHLEGDGAYIDHDCP